MCAYALTLRYFVGIAQHMCCLIHLLYVSHVPVDTQTPNYSETKFAFFVLMTLKVEDD